MLSKGGSKKTDREKWLAGWLAIAGTLARAYEKVNATFPRLNATLLCTNRFYFFNLGEYTISRVEVLLDRRGNWEIVYGG